MFLGSGDCEFRQSTDSRAEERSQDEGKELSSCVNLGLGLGRPS